MGLGNTTPLLLRAIQIGAFNTKKSRVKLVFFFFFSVFLWFAVRFFTVSIYCILCVLVYFVLIQVAFAAAAAVVCVQCCLHSVLHSRSRLQLIYTLLSFTRLQQQQHSRVIE